MAFRGLAVESRRKFRGICRGLIEGDQVRARLQGDGEKNSAASAAASLKGQVARQALLAEQKIPRHLPRPH